MLSNLEIAYTKDLESFYKNWDKIFFNINIIIKNNRIEILEEINKHKELFVELNERVLPLTPLKTSDILSILQQEKYLKFSKKYYYKP